MVILVVEDEGLINWMVTEELRRAGYDAISAYTADEAITILEGRDDISVVFTDIAVRNRWPPVRIIVTSGKRHPGADMLPKQSLFLPKPYAMENLLQSVRSLT